MTPTLKNRKRLGILGGLGPMSTVYFYELITKHTLAKKDQDHLDILISSRASTPDRTAFITGNSDENPLYAMIEEGNRLEAAGAELIAIPCNTAHFFYHALTKALCVPLLNIIEETVRAAKEAGLGRLGILATDGTVLSDSYGIYCEKYGLDRVYPAASHQAVLEEIIYRQIKADRPVAREPFDRVCSSLFDEGCEALVLGCTELSLLKRRFALGERFLDASEVLALRSIVACGGTPAHFPDSLKNSLTGEVYI